VTGEDEATMVAFGAIPIGAAITDASVPTSVTPIRPALASLSIVCPLILLSTVILSRREMLWQIRFVR
jgi:hypothetical protein